MHHKIEQLQQQILKALVPRIYPEAESVSAYGGEELVPLLMVRFLSVLNLLMVYFCLEQSKKTLIES